MKKKTELILSAVFLILFIVLIILLKNVDQGAFIAEADGNGKTALPTDSIPGESYVIEDVNAAVITVGLSQINEKLLPPRNDSIFKITEYLGYAAFLTAFGFACFGAYQLFSRKSFAKVDSDIYVLGAFYTIVICLYFAFAHIGINCRPVFMDGVIEQSFPSSHTVLSLCVFLSAIYQFRRRIPNKTLRVSVCTFCGLLAVVTTVLRYLSGAHWFTDIVGGVLISASLLLAYSAAEKTFK